MTRRYVLSATERSRRHERPAGGAAGAPTVAGTEPGDNGAAPRWPLHPNGHALRGDWISVLHQASRCPERVLAVAVCYRALLDLAHPPDTKDRDVRDAASFLLERLWEPTNIWGEMLTNDLSVRVVARAVRRWLNARDLPTLPRHLRARLRAANGRERPR
jgi:hypothetical protein